MNPRKNIHRNIPPDPKNPFRVPEGYFDDVQRRVMERIRDEEEVTEEKIGVQFPGSEKTAAEAAAEKQQPGEFSGGEVSRRKKIFLQPYITLAAAISGVALVVYIVLQSVIGTWSGDDTYDIATLDKAGIIQDESVLAETFTGEEDESTYSEWDEEAIVYLASNEVDLLDLIDTN